MLRLVSLALIALLVLGLFFLRGRGPSDSLGIRRPGGNAEVGPCGVLLAERETEGTGAVRKEVTTEETEQGPDDAADVQPEESPPFRGLLLDVATEEPIPFARAVVGALQCEVGADGRFDAEAGLPPDASVVEFHDPFLRTHIRTLRTDQLEFRQGSKGGEYVARIAIGPTYRVRIHGATSAEGWRVRLVELSEDGEEHQGSYHPPHPGAPFEEGGVPFLRYDNRWKPNEPGSRFRVDVESAEGWAGSSSFLFSAIGIYPEVVVVAAVREIGALIGIVVDTRDAPRKGARVSAVPMGTGTGVARFLTTLTDDDGAFSITSLRTGFYRLNVQARRGQEAVSLDVEVLGGKNDVGKLVVGAHESAGRIEGTLMNRSGAPIQGRMHVRLRAIDGRSFEMLDVTSPIENQSNYVYLGNGMTLRRTGMRMLRDMSTGNEGHVFEFASVSAGVYELSVLSRDGMPWTPATQRVTPPNEKVVFMREDGIQKDEHTFDVRGENDVPLGDFFLQVQLGRAFSTELVTARPATIRVPRSSSFSWSLRARGYRPAHGDESDFKTDGALLLASVKLEPGWGARLILRDLGGGFLLDDEDGSLTASSRAPVVGARILADGVVAAESDAAGIADLALDALPGEIAIDAPGWRVVEAGRLRNGRIAGDAVDLIVWLTRQ